MATEIDLRSFKNDKFFGDKLFLEEHYVNITSRFDEFEYVRR